MSRWNRVNPGSVTVAILLILMVGFLLPALQLPRNCGGNTAALSNVVFWKAFVEGAVAQDAKHRFCINTATPEQREQFAFYARAGMISNAHHFLVSTLPYTEETRDPGQVLMVCDTPFTNVPQGRFFSSPPTHAAMFQDGNFRLISVDEFKALDKSTLVPLDSLVGKLKP
jgi:hypothetical protein